jgi:NAD-dependent dihydropyrimidine dehydrogenase PreA subunit
MLRYLSGVVTLVVDRELCTGCRLCTRVCPRAVLAMEGATVTIRQRDACIECGACAMNCEAEAISVRTGVGCAAGVIAGWRRGTEPVCDCGNDNSC